MLNTAEVKYGDILVLFKVPTEVEFTDDRWMEQLGMELHACLTDSDYAHCEMHFVQSDVGLGCGVDVNGAVFLWNKEYSKAAYACVYRIKLAAARYNAVLRWAIETVDKRPIYDRKYMTRYCWLCWFRHCLPLACSRSRQDAYTCASLTFSALAIAGLTDLTAGTDRETRHARQDTMLQDRMVTVVDVYDMLTRASRGYSSMSSDVITVVKLDGVPHKLSLKIETGK